MGGNLPTVIHRTHAELAQQRAGLLAQAGMTYPELQAAAEVWSLTMRQLNIWRTIQGIDYLLGDDGGVA